jgi:uncharacterized membrane protein YvbJ
MINTKSKIIITIIVVILIIIAIVVNNKNQVKQEDAKQSLQTLADINYDEETGLYYIKDESTGEIIYASEDEDDPELQFYKEHPDYNPNPLSSRSTDLSSFASFKSEEEQDYLEFVIETN